MKMQRPQNHIRLIMTGTDIYDGDLRELVRLAGRIGLNITTLQTNSDAPGINIVEHVLAAINADPEANKGNKGQLFSQVTKCFGGLSLENLAVLSFEEFLNLDNGRCAEYDLLIKSHLYGLMIRFGARFADFDPSSLLKTPLVRNQGPYSKRLTNMLINGGLRWFEQLALITKFEAQGIRNLGGRYLDEAETALREHVPPLSFLGG